ncbi:MAG: S8 family serine peptidase [Bacteroidota bacterium]
MLSLSYSITTSHASLLLNMGIHKLVTPKNGDGTLKKFLAIYFLFGVLIYPQEIIQKGNQIYLSNTLVVKLKGAKTETVTGSKIFKELNTTRFDKIFKEEHGVLFKGESPLSNIYLLNYSSNEDPEIAAKKIKRLDNVEWAEPKYVREAVYEPNDPKFLSDKADTNLQTNLKRIFAEEAWDITKGDSLIIIGIVDTGVDWNHPDLAANILKDNGGYVIGHDFGGLDGTEDDDPSEDEAQNSFGYHGTHVAGIAAAATDNGIGIASIGFNSTILPVKASRSDQRDISGTPYIVYGFEGIKYAADNGAKIINCSWGGYSYSLAEQEVIDYAISKGALVVAAAGNNGSTEPFYPASYVNVLSVGWLKTANDQRSTAANHGIYLDVMAPGDAIYSTWALISNFSYVTVGGSSMSSPLTAGLAALVLSKYKHYSPLQIAERIRMTAESIDGANSIDENFLFGRGRINAVKALREENLVSIRATEIHFAEVTGNGNGNLQSGETISIEITFTNFLHSISGATVTLETDDSSVQIVNGTFQLPFLDTLETANNSSNKFTFNILPGAPYDHELDFRLLFSADNYTDFQWIRTKINKTFDTHNSGNIVMSVTSKGALGFNDYSDNLEGSGFRYMNGDNLLFEGALMYGISSNKLMDVARTQTVQSTDFEIVSPIVITSPGATAFQEGYTNFTDAGAGVSQLGISTHFYTYSFNSPPDENYIIIRTAFHNSTQNDIDSLYAGFFYDWDIPVNDYLNNVTKYDYADNFGYAYNTANTNVYVGSALISHDSYGYYPIDNSIVSGEIYVYGGLNDQQKWAGISSGIKGDSAGVNDISFITCGGPFDIPAGQTVSVAFSIAAGSTLEELRNAIIQSRIKYQSIPVNVEEEKQLPTDFILYQNYPNPFNPSTTISYKLQASSYVTLKVYDVLGREIATLVNEEQLPGKYRVKFDVGANQRFALSSGVYFYRLVVSGANPLTADDSADVKKMILIK